MQIIKVVEKQEAEFALEELLRGQELRIYEDVRARQFFRISSRGNSLTFFAGNHVGFIPLNPNLALLVEPKIAQQNRENWLHIIGKARGYLKELQHLRSYSRSMSSAMPVIEFLARALVRQLLSVEQSGFYRNYSLQKEVTSYPRGRFMFSESIQKAWGRGLQHAVAVEYYVFSKDIPHNRLLKHSLNVAIRYIKAFTDLDQVQNGALLRDDLKRLEDIFTKVPLDYSLSYLPAVKESLKEKTIPLERDYYYDVCKTALMLVDHEGITPLFFGEKETLSFVVNMERVFEDYCFHVLNDTKNSAGWDRVLRGRAEATKGLFEQPCNDKREADPDIVIQDVTGTKYPLEVKYKDKPSRQDINQAVTYGLAYGVDTVILICYSNTPTMHPRRYFHGSVGGQIALWTCRICLDTDSIEEEEALFAHSIANILSGDDV